MYSHKRSFTGQSSRSFIALLDIPFLIVGFIFSGIFSIAHSAITFHNLHDHIRLWPLSLQQIPTAALRETLRSNAFIFDYQLIFSNWLGLFLPFFIFSIINRWSLASLRISVQRSVTLGYLFAFYVCSFMTIALMNSEWTPGNRLVNLFHSFGATFFQSVRAILCMFLLVAAIMTLTKNATSRFNRNVRWLVVALFTLTVIIGDYLLSQKQRKVHNFFSKTQNSVRFIFVVPGLQSDDLQKSLNSENSTHFSKQISSLYSIYPSTSSQLGQFASAFLGLEPYEHGVRTDFTDPESLKPLWNTISQKTVPKDHSIYALSVGGPSPLGTIVEPSTPGQRCVFNPEQLAKLGHFQASVIPYALAPKYFESFLIPQLQCSNRFLSLEQHLLRGYEQVTNQLHSPTPKTFLLWISPDISQRVFGDAELPDNTKTWNAGAKNIYKILKIHEHYLTTTELIKKHKTFILGLSTQPNNMTTFAELDGQISTKEEQNSFDTTHTFSQLNVAKFLQDYKRTNFKNPQYFYSEFTDSASQNRMETLQPSVQKRDFASKLSKNYFVTNSDLLRKNLINSQRHIICKNVLSADQKVVSMRVSLELLSKDNRLPRLTYEEIALNADSNEHEKTSLDECLKTAKDQLTLSVNHDISLRDSSALRTLLSGLPVKSVQMGSLAFETSNETDNAELDKSTSAIPNVPDEEQE